MTIKLNRGSVEWLEEAAEALLSKDRKSSGVYKHSDKNDILLDHQIKLRQRKEIYTGSGSPDPNIIQGVYGRAYNPLLRRQIGNKDLRTKYWTKKLSDFEPTTITKEEIE